MGDADTSWLPLPDNPLPVDEFWSQFWVMVNYFSPLILPMLGLALGTIAIFFVIKNAFKTGGG